MFLTIAYITLVLVVCFVGGFFTGRDYGLKKGLKKVNQDEFLRSSIERSSIYRQGFQHGMNSPR